MTEQKAMMVERDVQNVRCRRLRWLVLCFGILLIPAVVLWLANVEQALRVVAPGIVLLSVITPPVLWSWFVTLSADLSSVSTLVPVLLLWFPLQQARKILRAGGDAEASYRYGLEPYPQHFTFFLVMLGLVGTLYGLLLGLSVSGLSGVVDGAPAAEDLPAVLERLMAGTATALLSSLVGLIGAFLAARPLTALFTWSVAIETVEGDSSIEEAVEHLRERLSALSVAVGDFSEQIGGSGLHRVLEHLDQISSAQAETAATLRACQEQVEALAQGQAAMAGLVTPVGDVPPLLRELVTATGAVADRLDGVAPTQAQLLQTAVDMLRVVQAGQQNGARLAAVVEADVQQRAQEAVRERTRLRRALQHFADDLPTGGQSDGRVSDNG